MKTKQLAPRQPRNALKATTKNQSQQGHPPPTPVPDDLTPATVLPDSLHSQPLRRFDILQLQQIAGNRYVQQVVDQTPVVQRRKEGRGSKKLPDKAPDAASLIAAQYPQLNLPEEQIAIVQKVLDARLKIEKANEKLKGLHIRKTKHGWYGISSDVQKAERIKAGLSKEHDILRKHKFLAVPTETLLSKDILADGKEDIPAEMAFRETIYKELIANNARLVINPGLEPKTLFDYYWGGARIGHNDGGLIEFRHLMYFQTWNLAYTKVLLGEQIEVLNEMLEIRREIGGTVVDAHGKKLGETYGHVWNSDIKVKSEIGPVGGYYDDPEGRAALSQAYLKARGARCVIRGPDNWLHIFSLTPFKGYDLKGEFGDDYVYLLTSGAEVVAERVTTGDGFELTLASGPTGTGWRMEKILSEVEQFAIGAFFGDFVEDAGASMSVGQIIVGCIPIVGQIADARDVAAGLYKMWKTGGKDGKVQTLMAMVGFVPLFGDGIKAAKKAFAEGGQAAAKEVFAKTIREGSAEASEALAKQIIKNPKGVAEALGMSKSALSELSELGMKAVKEGGEAAEQYAAKMLEHWRQVGGDAAALVTIGGGKWATVAKALANSPAGAALGKEMHVWRVAQFDAVEANLKRKVGDFGFGLRMDGQPQMVRTGTDSVLSDVDISFVGPHATVHRNAAIRQMEMQYGPNWQEVLDADIFADPARLHLFEDPLAELGGKAARDAEKRIVSESELNVLAKMLQGGADPKQVSQTAKTLGIDMAAVTARQGEVAQLSTDYLANLLRKGTPESQVAKMADEMGVSLEAVKAYKATGADVYRHLELKLDVLHRRFLRAAGDPAKQAEIAEEMAAIQGKLNAAVPGPYITPGGGAKHVTRREAQLRPPMGPYQALSPAMGYTALLDDYFMLQHALKDVGAEFSEKQAKSLAKYGDRLLMTAGQYGVDMTDRSVREILDKIELVLKRARLEKSKPPLSKIQPDLAEVRRRLESQLDELAETVKQNADHYLLQAGKPSKAERRSVKQMLDRSKEIITKQLLILARIKVRDAKSESESGEAAE